MQKYPAKNRNKGPPLLNQINKTLYEVLILELTNETANNTNG